MALSSIPNEVVKPQGTKKAAKHFEQIIRSLTEG